jgi:hypothetical protein
MIDLTQFNGRSPTADEAKGMYYQEAQEEARNNGGDLIAAYRTTRQKYPAIAALAGVSSPRLGQTAPQITAADSNPLPIPSQDNIAALMLPKDVDLETFNRCFKANGSQCVTLDHQAVFDALSDSLRGRYSCSPDEADARAAQRAPALAAKANSTLTARTLAAQDPQPGDGYAPSTRAKVAPSPVGKALSPAPRTGLDVFRPRAA